MTFLAASPGAADVASRVLLPRRRGGGAVHVQGAVSFGVTDATNTLYCVLRRT